MTCIAPEDLIDNSQLREAVVEWVELEGNSWANLARALGHFKKRAGFSKPQPDVSLSQRRLGLRDWTGGSIAKGTQRKYRQKRVNYDLAVEIIRAIGADPVDFGV